MKRRDFSKRINALLLLPMLGLLAGCLGDLKYAGTAANKDYGNVLVGDSVDRSFTWNNQGTGKSTIFGARLTGPDTGSFAIAAAGISAEVPVNGTSPPLTVAFAPQSVGTKQASVKLRADGEKEEVALTGTGVAQITIGDLGVIGGNVAPGQVLDFGNVRVGATSAPLRFLLRNNSSNIHTVSVTWVKNNQGFSVSAPGQTFAVPPGGIQVSLTFAPTAVGDFADAVKFSVAGGAHIAGTSVKGKGVAGQ